MNHTLLAPLFALSLACFGTSCASTSSGASADVRVIDDMPALEALPSDARPVIKVSVNQSAQNEVPSEYRWLFALSRQNGSVASGENLESKVRRALMSTGRFHVRTSNFADLQQERELERDGLMEAGDSVDAQVVKAEYAIICNVEDLNFSESESGNNWGVSRLPLVGGYLGGGSKTREATVTISAEIVNLRTGLAVQAVEGRGFQVSSANQQTVGWGGISYSQQEKENPTLANAITECIKELVYEIGKAMPAKG